MNWISVKERKPKEGRWVLACYKDRVEKAVHIGPGDGFYLPDVAYMPFDATHWMDLPLSYDQEREKT